MLSEQAVAFLSPLRFRPDAQRLGCLLPLAGIYWDDEIPDFDALLNLGKHGRLILRLFSIRFKIWNKKALSENDQCFWDEAKSQVPNFPLFQRLELSSEDQSTQEQVERNTIEGFKALETHADEVLIRENELGLKSFSVKYDLINNKVKVAKKRPWWKRLFFFKETSGGRG